MVKRKCDKIEDFSKKLSEVRSENFIMPRCHFRGKKTKILNGGKGQDSETAARNTDQGGEWIKLNGYFRNVEDLAEELQIVSTKGNHAATVAQKGNMTNGVKGTGQVEKRNIIAENGGRIAVNITGGNHAGEGRNRTGREKGTFQREF